MYKKKEEEKKKKDLSRFETGLFYSIVVLHQEAQ